MDMQEKIAFMQEWAESQGARLELEGECGFFRECVGILVGEGAAAQYPMWSDDYAYLEEAEPSSWQTPGAEPPGSVKDYYHKASVLCVLGRGDDAINQLYDWVQSLSDNGVVIRPDGIKDGVLALLGQETYVLTTKRREATG